MRGLFNEAYMIFFLIIFLKAYVFGSHLNYLEDELK